MHPVLRRRKSSLNAVAMLTALTVLPCRAGPAPAPPPVTLEFKDLLEATPRELRPTARLTSLNGRHVRMVGFMAKLDAPITGAFYLCPGPTFGDEEGGGTADLPPQAVRVLVSTYRGHPMPYVSGPVSVTGTLHIGPIAVENGQVSMLQLTLDRAAPRAPRKPRPATAARQTIRSTPVQSTPVQSTPVQSTPVQSTPVQSMPVQSMPVQK